MSDYLMEAFRQLDLLEEEDFSLDSKGLSDAKEFLDSDDDVEVALNVIDPEVDTEEEVKDTYVGDVVCQCDVCKSLVYKNPDEIEVSEDGEFIDETEECPFCFNVGSLKIIGKVEPFVPEETLEDEEGMDDDIEVSVDDEPIDLSDVDDTEIADTDTEDEEDDEEDLDESLQEGSKADKLRAFIRQRKGGDDVEESLQEGSKADKLRAFVRQRFNDGEVEESLDECNDTLQEGEKADRLRNYARKLRGEKVEEKLNKGSKSRKTRNESIRRKNRRKLSEGFRGCKNVEMIWNGTQSDPELEYKGQRFNYWDIESALWDQFIEERPEYADCDGSNDAECEEEFNLYVQENCENYLEDCIFGGYFDESLNESDKLTETTSKIENALKKAKPGSMISVVVNYGDNHQPFRALRSAIKNLGLQLKEFDPGEYDPGELQGEANGRFSGIVPTKFDFSKFKNCVVDISGSHKYSEDVEYAINSLKKVGAIIFQVCPADDYKNYRKFNPTTIILSTTDESLTESFEEVNIKTDDQTMRMTQDPDSGKVTVETEPIRNDDFEDDSFEMDADFSGDMEDDDEFGDETGDEMIVPLDSEDEEELSDMANDEEFGEEETEEGDEESEEDEEEDSVDYDVDEMDEDSFDELGESYLRNVYGNVKSYKTTSAASNGSSIVLEGIIEFNSGNKKKTSFLFTPDKADSKGNVRFIGENLQITRGKKSFQVKGKMNRGKFISESFRYNYMAKDENGKSTRLYGTIKSKK